MHQLIRIELDLVIVLICLDLGCDLNALELFQILLFPDIHPFSIAENALLPPHPVSFSTFTQTGRLLTI